MKKNGKKKFNGIAVVGMANIFPKALNTRQFLENIINKKNCIITIPDNRWPGPVDNYISEQILPDKAVSKKAGLIENFNFEPEDFLVDRDLLSELDTVHQLVLQAGKDAFSQCSHTTENKKNTGVILAAIALPTDASSQISWKIICGNGNKDIKSFKGLTPKDFSKAGVVSLPAAILARALGLEGGCFTLDAACASSLYSIKLACEQLYLKKNDIMVAGGVSRPDSLYTQIGFSQLQALSPTGRCSAFDKNADGLVVGEGAGIVILKRIEDAIECGDKIHAVITGAGVSNDIEGTLVGPASEGQIRAMTKAYEQACWSPGDIQYMECHGSGTPVGDQVELSSIKALLDNFDSPDKHLAIGSVKSMTGHLLTAAGAAGFIKTILSMNEGFLPPSLNYSKASSKSPLNYSNIKVQTIVEEWEPSQNNPRQNSNKDLTRKAGISAFGFGGINAHILIEEYQKTASHYFVKNPEQSKTLKKEFFQNVPIAIVGMGIVLKDCDSLSRFKDIVFGKTSLAPEKPASRWKKSISNQIEEKSGLYINNICCEPGEFHIPPNQMDDILPQHIILLKAAKKALEDAMINPRPKKGEPKRDDFGCAIGIEFDYGATNFYLRWKMNHLDEESKDDISPPLTFNRTLGALGGIVASRVAREFKLGGPCFTLSAGSASGIKAIETGINSLSSYETNLFICGSVDLACDIRQFALNEIAKNKTDKILPSEGAGAMVLKRVDQALEDGDRIYGVITGVAGSCGSIIPGEQTREQTREQTDEQPAIQKGEPKKEQDHNLYIQERLYKRSLENALKNASISFKDINIYEACMTGIIDDEVIEARVLKEFFSKYNNQDSCNIASISKTIGNTRGASSIFSVIKTALLLHSRQADFGYDYGQTASPVKIDLGKIDYDKIDPNQPVPDKTDWACVASISMDGTFSHVIIQGVQAKKQISDQNATSHSNANTADNSNPNANSDSSVDSILDSKFESYPASTINLTNSQTETSLNSRTNFILNPDLIAKGSFATSNAHEKFLEFSKNNMQTLEDQFKTLTQLASKVIKESNSHETTDIKRFQQKANPEPYVQPDMQPGSKPDLKFVTKSKPTIKQSAPAPFLNREQCLEYAVGKAGNVLGSDFEIIDTYPVRVRLPAEPLMLVDRIMDIQGEKLSLTSGKIITQHDVKENSWYLDGNKAPVSITIEAGQADLFLCAWLGIDHAVKGKRKYRLLDAKVTFHRTLPDPGETIEYHIEIDRFLKQGDVYLFFFHYKGYINDQLLISMKDGCAGFFTEQEVEDSGGIILKPEEFEPLKPIEIKPVDLKSGQKGNNFSTLVPVKKLSFSDEKTDALRAGNLENAFGNNFKNKKLGINLRLPGKRMNLIDRILEFDPEGGRFALGSITAEADIHGDEWFLKCHFIDDMVMPGTLMYECCAHALRVFTQRMGWISDRDDVFYDVVLNNESDLKCRGPVTIQTKKVRYEIEIKKMAYNPEPYVIADAHMFSDDLRIVLYKNMGLKIVGLTKNDFTSLWEKY